MNRFNRVYIGLVKEGIGGARKRNRRVKAGGWKQRN